MLAQEITNSGLTDDAEIVSYFNELVIDAKGSIQTSAIKQYLTLRNLRLVIKDGVSLACKEATQALEDFQSFDCSVQIIQGKLMSVLDSLIAEDLGFIEQDKTTILGLADIKISRAESLGLVVNFETVAQALRG